MNTSEKPVESNFLRRHPRHYADEPEVGKIEFNDPNYRAVGEKIGGKGKRDKAHNEKIAELMRELEKERKRSARWKKLAKKKNATCDILALMIKELRGDK